MGLTWKYSREHDPSAPVVNASIGAFGVELLVDTGFSGGVLLPFPLFQSLGFMSRLEPESYAIVLPDHRKMTAYTALSDVTIESMRVASRIHSTPSMDKRLLGRQTLNKIIAVLDGPKETLTISPSP